MGKNVNDVMKKMMLFVLILIFCEVVYGDEPVLLFPIVRGGKWGYIDQNGKVVIEPQYDGAGDFSEGLAWVGKGLQRGYIDKTGTIVINPRFGWAGNFHCGIAAVFGHHDGKPMGARADDIWGDDIQMYQPQAGMYYIDRTGKIIDGKGCSPTDFSEGKACYRRTVIDTEGKIISHDAEVVSSFSDGLAAARKAGKWGYIDHNMKWIIEPQFDMAGLFREGLAAVAKSSLPPPTDPNKYSEWRRARKTFRWGYIDKSGKLVIDYQFNDADVFSEGMAAVVPQAEGNTMTWGYVNKKGVVVIKPQYDYAWRFSEGLARVMVKGRFGYVDKSGKWVVAPKYDSAWEFSNGLARVAIGSSESAKEGYINRDGEYVWEPTE